MLHEIISEIQTKSAERLYLEEQLSFNVLQFNNYLNKLDARCSLSKDDNRELHVTFSDDTPIKPIARRVFLEKRIDYIETSLVLMSSITNEYKEKTAELDRCTTELDVLLDTPMMSYEQVCLDILEMLRTLDSDLASANDQ